MLWLTKQVVQLSTAEQNQGVAACYIQLYFLFDLTFKKWAFLNSILF